MLIKPCNVVANLLSSCLLLQQASSSLGGGQCV